MPPLSAREGKLFVKTLKITGRIFGHVLGAILCFPLLLVNPYLAMHFSCKGQELHEELERIIRERKRKVP